MAEDNNSINPMEQALDNFNQVQVGDVVEAEVLSIDDHQLVVGIDNSGVEGVVPARELSGSSKTDIHELAKVGDKLELLVMRRSNNDKEDGSFILSQRRIANRKKYEKMAQLQAEDATVTGQVTGTVKSGLLVDIDGLRGFVPASMISDHFVRDLKRFVGQELELKIIEVEAANNRFVLSHKEIAAAQKAEQEAKVFAELLPGDVLEAQVSRLTNFGAFIDLGGVDGLVHISQISHQHIAKPSDVLEPGQTVKVKVLDLDPERGRISLSIKATQPGPWEDAAAKIAPGDEVDGVVRRLTDFGAFIEVLPGVEGLLHVSQISWDRINKPADVLEVGQELHLKVLNLDVDQKRLGLSLKALIPDPHAKEETKEPEDDHYTLPEEERGFSLGDMVDADQFK
ncbi:30S ribosomal protein S1 [Lactobacillus sp. DCY120]|uniref:30S ribosomal protein S1 n=1 Tax=Bombilactobacillus apium TaxID=2675299 RepID=A0A850R4J2_9LACO|nr:30S ribosomal protein S1 [Bombilactobacillus apium]NVY95757.1 30S ribosomal protein S1 [Bombilactobacillus apium]